MAYGSSGIDAGWLAQAAQETGQQLSIQPRPELPDHLQPVWEAFCMLSRSRSVSFGGPLPITISEMRQALEIFEVPKGAWEEWLYLVQELDAAWLKAMAERRGKEGQGG